MNLNPNDQLLVDTMTREILVNYWSLTPHQQQRVQNLLPKLKTRFSLPPRSSLSQTKPLPHPIQPITYDRMRIPNVKHRFPLPPHVQYPLGSVGNQEQGLCILHDIFQIQRAMNQYMAQGVHPDIALTNAINGVEQSDLSMGFTFE